MENFSKLNRQQMRNITGGVAASNSCEADCDDGSTVTCYSDGDCRAFDGLGCAVGNILVWCKDADPLGNN